MGQWTFKRTSEHGLSVCLTHILCAHQCILFPVLKAFTSYILSVLYKCFTLYIVLCVLSLTSIPQSLHTPGRTHTSATAKIWEKHQTVTIARMRKTQTI